ncbi:DUF6264 family protein [Amnibacterium flavum]|nr:DUF6264 family protein [Amnibacterium flavum]
MTQVWPVAGWGSYSRTMSTEQSAVGDSSLPAGTSGAAARTRRTWDLVLSIVLLVVLVGFGAIAAFAGAFLAFASDPCTAQTCDYDLLNAGVLTAMLSPVVIALIAIIVTVLLLVRRRLAFWVPLAAYALITAVWVTAAIVVSSAVEV